jgi:hypothetical protein
MIPAERVSSSLQKPNGHVTLSLVVIVQRTEFKALTDNVYKQVVAGLSER